MYLRQVVRKNHFIAVSNGQRLSVFQADFNINYGLALAAKTGVNAFT